MRFAVLFPLALFALSTSASATLQARSDHGAALSNAHRRHHAKQARALSDSTSDMPQAKVKKANKKRCKPHSSTSSSTSTSTTSSPTSTTYDAPSSTYDPPSSTSTSTTPAPAPTTYAPAPHTSTSTTPPPAPSTTSAAPAANAAPAPSPNAAPASNALAGVTAFLGTNTGGIGSWFRTNSGSDSTDGTSWCQLKYQDSWMGTAIPVDAMIASTGGDALAAMKLYCGLEIEATDPSNGNTVTMYVVDGFDQAWVLTPSSMDLTIAAFTALYGSFDNNKDTVVKNMSWKFTGNRNSQYAYNAGN